MELLSEIFEGFETEILRELFEEKGISDTLPIIQKYIDKYNFKVDTDYFMFNSKKIIDKYYHAMKKDDITKCILDLCIQNNNIQKDLNKHNKSKKFWSKYKKCGNYYEYYGRRANINMIIDNLLNRQIRISEIMLDILNDKNQQLVKESYFFNNCLFN
jgi:hypothetical protein